MKALLTPRWIAAHVLVVVITVVFVNLGLWQLRRLDERQLQNAVAGSRYSVPPEPLAQLLEAAGGDFESLEFRRATVMGTFDVDAEVLMRNQVYREQAGFHVVTPLVSPESDRAVLVNRGWVPLALDTPPVTEAAPPSGEVAVTGHIALSQERPPLGPQDPDNGVLTVMNRVDIERISEQVPYEFAPVYLVLESAADELPVPVPPPSFDDEGSHLAYAIQWFGFTIIGLVGYGSLIRKNLSKS